MYERERLGVCICVRLLSKTCKREMERERDCVQLRSKTCTRDIEREREREKEREKIIVIFNLLM